MVMHREYVVYDGYSYNIQHGGGQTLCIMMVGGAVAVGSAVSTKGGKQYAVTIRS